MKNFKRIFWLIVFFASLITIYPMKLFYFLRWKTFTVKEINTG